MKITVHCGVGGVFISLLCVKVTHPGHGACFTSNLPLSDNCLETPRPEKYGDGARSSLVDVAVQL